MATRGGIAWKRYRSAPNTCCDCDGICPGVLANQEGIDQVELPTTNDPSSASTASAISAVPIQPNPTSQDCARKRPMSLVLDTITIIITMLGIETLPVSTELHT